MGVNSLTLAGYVSRSAVLTTLRSGQRQLVFPLGYPEPYRAEDGSRRIRYSFIYCVMFGAAAVRHHKLLHKNRKVLVEGRLHQNTIATSPERGFHLLIDNIDYGYGMQRVSDGKGGGRMD